MSCARSGTFPACIRWSAYEKMALAGADGGGLRPRHPQCRGLWAARSRGPEDRVRRLHHPEQGAGLSRHLRVPREQLRRRALRAREVMLTALLLAAEVLLGVLEQKQSRVRAMLIGGARGWHALPHTAFDAPTEWKVTPEGRGVRTVSAPPIAHPVPADTGQLCVARTRAPTFAPVP